MHLSQKIRKDLVTGRAGITDHLINHKFVFCQIGPFSLATMTYTQGNLL